MRPMLAASFPRSDLDLLCNGDNSPLEKLQYPVLCTPKIDGIRCVTRSIIVHDVLVSAPHIVGLSRSLKPIPNKHIQAALSFCPANLDGELTVGENFQMSTSGIMSYDGKPDFRYHVFDEIISGTCHATRLEYLKKAKLPDFCNVLYPVIIPNADHLIAYEKACIGKGFEGVIIRDPSAPYKHGRSTFKQGWMIKLKRFVQSEAVVTGFEELEHNENKATEDKLGYQVRSTERAGMVSGDTLGALVVKDTQTDVEFRCGSGFDQATRDYIWKNREFLRGEIITYRYQSHGTKDKPRIPIFLGFRDREDM